MNNNPTPFRLALVEHIKNTIRTERAHGTTGMSLETLYRVVRPPSSVLAGAPRGTNEAYYYREMFEEVARKVAGRFIIS